MRGRRATAGLTFVSVTLLSLSLLLPSALPVPGITEGPWAAWTTQTVDETFASFPLGIDTLPDGRPVISYRGGGVLKVATQTTTGWNIQTIHTGSTYASDIAADSDGHLHVAYLDHDSTTNVNTLTYTTNTGNTWTFNPIEWGIGATRITLDTTNTPHITYVTWDDKIKYATPDGNGGWTTETINTTPFRHISIDVDSQGTPHVVYFNNGIVTHAKRTNTGWTTTTVPKCNSYPSIALDANDLAHVACRTPNGDGIGLLHAYETSPGTWAWEEAIDGSELVPPVGDNQLAIGTDIVVNRQTGTVHVASFTNTPFQTLGDANPIYASKTLAGWNANTIDNTNHDAGDRIQLALDGNGVPHVAYSLDVRIDPLACTLNTCFDLQYARPATALPEALLPLGTLP